VKNFLGEGGKKRVYLATDTLLDRDVAFALIRPMASTLSGASVSGAKRGRWEGLAPTRTFNDSLLVSRRPFTVMSSHVPDRRSSAG